MNEGEEKIYNRDMTAFNLASAVVNLPCRVPRPTTNLSNQRRSLSEIGTSTAHRRAT